MQLFLNTMILYYHRCIYLKFLFAENYASQEYLPYFQIRIIIQIYAVELFSNLQVETLDDYDEYCHYVAGLVGLGLSKLFHASGSEDLFPDSLSNSMGLFLQVS